MKINESRDILKYVRLAVLIKKTLLRYSTGVDDKRFDILCECCISLDKQFYDINKTAIAKNQTFGPLTEDIVTNS